MDASTLSALSAANFACMNTYILAFPPQRNRESLPWPSLSLAYSSGFLLLHEALVSFC
jgi:hypothetical protein